MERSLTDNYVETRLHANWNLEITRRRPTKNRSKTTIENTNEIAKGKKKNEKEKEKDNEIDMSSIMY